MRKVNYLLLAGVTLLVSGFTTFKSVEWQIAEGYSIKFKGTDAEGIFKTMTCELTFSENDLAGSAFSVSVDVASINTGNGTKNKHAKSEKWFDAKKYPHIRFNSTKFVKVTAGYQVDGILEMHGVKQQITIPFTFVSNTFEGKFSVNRMDFGVGTMEGMSKKVSNEIALEVKVPVTKKP